VDVDVGEVVGEVEAKYMGRMWMRKKEGREMCGRKQNEECVGGRVGVGEEDDDDNDEGE